MLIIKFVPTLFNFTHARFSDLLLQCSTNFAIDVILYCSNANRTVDQDDSQGKVKQIQHKERLRKQKD